jgi:hypothetical protein
MLHITISSSISCKIYSLSVEQIAKVEKKRIFYFSPLTLGPFPPKGAREVAAPQSVPAPFEGRISEGQEGGCFKYRLLQLAQSIYKKLFQSKCSQIRML